MSILELPRDVRPVGKPSVSPIVRFLRRIEFNGPNGCWLWLGGKDPDGYGAFFESRRPGSEQRAHRFAYKYYVGRVPNGLVLDHLCRVRHCVNPAHLEPVTSQENCRRGFWSSTLQTHCSRGHEYTPENTYRSRNQRGRKCRACHAALERQRRARRS